MAYNTNFKHPGFGLYSIFTLNPDQILLVVYLAQNCKYPNRLGPSLLNIQPNIADKRFALPRGATPRTSPPPMLYKQTNTDLFIQPQRQVQPIKYDAENFSGSGHPVFMSPIVHCDYF
ncbi:hypothetical protein YC2023_049567 [Brassica napus]